MEEDRKSLYDIYATDDKDLNIHKVLLAVLAIALIAVFVLKVSS